MDAAAWLRSVEDSNAQTEKRQKQQDLMKFVAQAKSFEELLPETAARVAEFFSSDRALVYLVDGSTGQLATLARLGGDLRELRLPLDAGSVAGFVALSKASICLRSVYDPAELARVHPKLKFDDRWDQATSFRTKAMMTVAITSDQTVLGVLQVMNRRDVNVFFPRDVLVAEEIARALSASIVTLTKAQEVRGARKAGKWNGLLEAGLIDAEALAKAVAQAHGAGVDPARYLIDKVGIAREHIERSLAAFHGCEFVRLTGREVIPPDLKARLRPDFLKKVCALPLERRGNQLVVVIDDPSDMSRTDAMRGFEPSSELVFAVGFRDEILAYIDQSLGTPRQEGVGSILKELSAADESAGAIEDVGDDEQRGGESDSAVIKLANQVIIDAFRRGASDIHIEPNGKEHATTIRFRIDGDCVSYSEIPPSIRTALVARLKIMAKLDISEKRKPQDGKIRFRMQDRQIELRIATLPTVNGNEDVVMRILAASKPIPLDGMGMSERNLTELKKIITKPYGLVLVVGPTGSGKTTTLHSALGHINTVDMKIWTAEDPVEITQPGLRQVQVAPKIGFDFATAMRAFLRADPDVIMVGEMRDKETAGMGVEASLTGHLVFSTLHTNSAPETITRLMDMGLDPFSFADALLGVLAQRLARGLCGKCKEEIVASPDEFATIAATFGEEAVEKRGWKEGQLKLWRGKGCETCGKTGYKGRVAIVELLVNNDIIKHAITRRAPVEEIRKGATDGGMATLLMDGIEKALAGKTDLKQVLAVCAK